MYVHVNVCEWYNCDSNSYDVDSTTMKVNIVDIGTNRKLSLKCWVARDIFILMYVVLLYL